MSIDAFPFASPEPEPAEQRAAIRRVWTQKKECAFSRFDAYFMPSALSLAFERERAPAISSAAESEVFTFLVSIIN